MLHFEPTQGLCPAESTSGGSKRDSIVGAELVPGSVFRLICSSWPRVLAVMEIREAQ